MPRRREVAVFWLVTCGTHTNPQKTLIFLAMSMFGIGGGAPGGGAPQGSVNANTIDVAVAELDMITDVFNKLVSYASPNMEC